LSKDPSLEADGWALILARGLRLLSLHRFLFEPKFRLIVKFAPIRTKNPICVFCNKSFDENHQRAGPIPSCKHFSHGGCLDKKRLSEENPFPTCKIEADIIQQALDNSGDGSIWDLVVKAYSHPIAKFLNCINLLFWAH
jgi:hypothetical protein